MNSPSEVVARALEYKRQRDWPELAALVDAPALEGFRREQTPTDPPPPPRTAEQYRKHDPDMPLEAAEYLVGKMTRHQPELSARFARVTSIEELAGLSDRDLLARFLEAHDGRAAMQREISEKHPELGEFTESFPPDPPSRVIGEIIENRTAFVLFASGAPGSGDRSHMGPEWAVLRRTGEAWALLPTGTLFHEHNFFSIEVSGSDEANVYPPLAVKQMPWLARRFEHLLPPELFPSVLLRFAAAPAQLSDWAVLPKRMRTMRLHGGWSIQEHVGHLLDLEELNERRLDEFIAGAERLSAADMANQKTEAASHNEAAPWDLVEQFRDARERLVGRLEKLTAEQIAHAALQPRLGRNLNVVEWVYFMAEHDDHHIARIRELLSEIWEHHRQPPDSVQP